MIDTGETLLEATAFGVIPVVEIDGVAEADALAEALLEAGLGVIEVTFRTRAAAEVIARIAERYTDMVVGAGTIISPVDLRRAIDAGARFALAPGLSAAMLDAAAEAGFAYVPGAMAASDLQAGLERGIRTFKFFPAMPAGGIAFLRAISAPFALHGLRFIPTGGVSITNLEEWIREPAVAAVGGTWIASRVMIREGDWAGIRRNAEEAVRLARRVREAG
ncbi:bifunctional 4-hydroxy-2-oxoglutarate aldolase/2-dehydro-3-deoxy-phosphogluconate aldolase (plasmid) [Lichenicola cladoniae]|uniref:2-dehydro-3-deoxy-phosphogluconate aldolase n=1 Tax=Lichenicola cladoniae TaxID=1484109 RepID=A0A6M8HYQ2_9PROT|nr:bifunctional 4-hydroxy-2-oxoglutarate aldolase/2-dehydro-3-deoxy-phosphogluconate aldolase [Lichenicola cladoniae]NPD67819.1 bifunctional 4-hydroxy-2-oxoglutarate aldolase/2-dehydro-3-deoxy-phosphogluconate aldolase [Acetobacteraceae bacterium]QKE93337.1 bifunctional 4-hydroxy-2-oxoglutarate aldolase/2-dehydro-3-deoxy-phosphogluconate aldolase [Lichenicola cladoniae]